MFDKPAVLCSEKIVSFLNDNFLEKALFTELAETEFPWEVDYPKFQRIREKLFHIENALRTQFPQREIACVITGSGAFWLMEETLAEYFRLAQEPLQTLRSTGPLDAWKLTTVEVAVTHLSNLRQLLMAVAHDMILLQFLQESLGNNHLIVMRQFENCEKYVRLLIDEIVRHSSDIVHASSEETILLERCRITQQMLEMDEVSEEELGYTLEELKRVEKVLEKRGGADRPAFRRRAQAAYNKMLASLRDSENAQLNRTSKWLMAFSLLGGAPVGFRGHAELCELERTGMRSIIASRELELGETAKGQEALKEADEAKTATARPMEEEIVNDQVESSEESSEISASDAEPRKLHKRHRMAFMSRRGR